MVITTTQKGVKGNTFTQFKVTGGGMKPVITNDADTAKRVNDARNRLDQKKRMKGIPKNPFFISTDGTPKISIKKKSGIPIKIFKKTLNPKKSKKVNLGTKLAILR